jgi:hypothetical protein
MDSENDETIDSDSGNELIDSDNDELLTMNLKKNQPILLILNNILVKKKTDLGTIITVVCRGNVWTSFFCWPLDL